MARSAVSKKGIPVLLYPAVKNDTALTPLGAHPLIIERDWWCDTSTMARPAVPGIAEGAVNVRNGVSDERRMGKRWWYAKCTS